MGREKRGDKEKKRVEWRKQDSMVCNNGIHSVAKLLTHKTPVLLLRPHQVPVVASAAAVVASSEPVHEVFLSFFSSFFFDLFFFAIPSAINCSNAIYSPSSSGLRSACTKVNGHIVISRFNKRKRGIAGDRGTEDENLLRKRSSRRA